MRIQRGARRCGLVRQAVTLLARGSRCLALFLVMLVCVVAILNLLRENAIEEAFRQLSVDTHKLVQSLAQLPAVPEGDGDVVQMALHIESLVEAADTARAEHAEGAAIGSRILAASLAGVSCGARKLLHTLVAFSKIRSGVHRQANDLVSSCSCCGPPALCSLTRLTELCDAIAAIVSRYRLKVDEQSRTFPQQLVILLEEVNEVAFDKGAGWVQRSRAWKDVLYHDTLNLSAIASRISWLRNVVADRHGLEGVVDVTARSCECRELDRLRTRG